VACENSFVVLVPFHKSKMTMWYPQNRLQSELRRRAVKIMTIFGGCVFALCLSMVFVQPSYASEAYDPTDAFSGIPSNAAVEAILDAAWGDCGSGSNCDDWAIYAGYSNSITVYANSTCIASWTSTGNGLGSQDTDQLAGSNESGFNGFRTVCYVSGVWATKNNGSARFTAVSGGVITNTDIYRKTPNCSNTLSSSYGIGNPACNSLLYSANNDSGTLTIETTGPYTVGQTISFVASWENAVNAYYLYFYEDIEETNPVRIVNNYPMGTTSDWTFTHSFAFDGTYHPFFVLGTSGCDTISSTGAITGTACTTYDSDSTVLSVVSQQAYASDLEATYVSSFTASKTADVIVGETVNFSYNLSSNFCTGSTVSGKRIFKGLPQSLSHLDAGTILASGLTGTSALLYDRTAQPYSDFFYPSILVYCANATSHRVYLGGSVLVNNAQGISVYEANDTRFAMPSTWLGGGSTTSGGTTYSFQSDKRLYRPGEQVKLSYRFRGTQPFTVSTILVYDTASGTLLTTLSGSDVLWGVSHYMSISYASAGEYEPMLKLRNAGNTLYKNVFLGGTHVATNNSLIIVNAQGSPLYVNTGAILGQHGGTGGVVNTNGIFALDFKIGWGNTGNTYLDTVQGLISPVIWALWWIAQKLYSILQATTLFSFLFEMIYPVDGSCHTVPAVIFDFPVDSMNIPTPAALAGTQFCISYTTEPNSEYLTKMLYIIMGITIFFWVLDLIIPNRSDK